MAGRRKDLDAGKRMEAVLSLLRREEPAAVIARRYGISENTMYRLREQFLDGGKSALAGRSRGTGQELKHLQREVEERDRVIGELTIANRILKKTQDGLR
jgi:transposase-like protein